MQMAELGNENHSSAELKTQENSMGIDPSAIVTLLARHWLIIFQ